MLPSLHKAWMNAFGNAASLGMDESPFLAAAMQKISTTKRTYHTKTSGIRQHGSVLQTMKHPAKTLPSPRGKRHRSYRRRPSANLELSLIPGYDGQICKVAARPVADPKTDTTTMPFAQRRDEQRRFFR